MASPGSFTSGAVLTAAEMNALPNGEIVRVTSTTNGTADTTEDVQLTTASFTAVAGRLYRITYSEPAAQTPAGAGNYIFLRIRLTNVSGTILNTAQIQNSGASAVANTCVNQIVTTLTAGSTVIVGSVISNSGAINLFRSAPAVAFLVVEDIGPA